MSIEELKQLDDFFSLKGVSKSTITEHENLIHLKFSNEYSEYLETYGIVSVNGHELTGIVESKRLNVVDVTLKNRKINPSIPKNFYVIEESNIDDIVFWQDENGIIYQTIGTSEPVKICNCLIEYVKSE
jgi:hypothetical protein